jgi:hypothetical protein
VLSEAVDWKRMRVAPAIKLAKVRGRDALMDQITESILIEELQQPVKHLRAQRLREQLRDILNIATERHLSMYCGNERLPKPTPANLNSSIRGCKSLLLLPFRWQ